MKKILLCSMLLAAFGAASAETHAAESQSKDAKKCKKSDSQAERERKGCGALAVANGDAIVANGDAIVAAGVGLGALALVAAADGGSDHDESPRPTTKPKPTSP